MNIFLEAIKENDALQNLLQQKSELGNLSLSEEALLFTAYFEEKQETLLIVKKNKYLAERLYERMIPLTTQDVLLFNVEESLRVEAIASSPQARASQIEVMSRLLEKRPCICITSTAGLMRYMPSVQQFKQHCFHLHVEQEYRFEDLKNDLFIAGYTHVNRIDQPLCYASRGGIIDVFSMNHEYPIRIEFFDNIIESIRYFDIATQRTIQPLQTIEIIPATTLLFDDQQISEIIEGANQDLEEQLKRMDTSLLQEKLQDTIQKDLDQIANYQMEDAFYRYYPYVKDKNNILSYVNGNMIIASIEEIVKQERYIKEESIYYIQELSQEGMVLAKFSIYEDLDQIIRGKHVIQIHEFVDYKHVITSGIYSNMQGDLGFQRTMEEIMSSAKEMVVYVCVNRHQKEEISTYLDERKISYQTITTLQRKQGIYFYDVPLAEGFTCSNENFSVYTAKELFQSVSTVTKYSDKFQEAEILSDYMELEMGDFVVHHQYGIGKYLGIMNKEVQGVHKDFLRIAYKGNDMLLVPLEQFHLIRKFVSKEGIVPRLHKLAGSEWEKTKEKVQNSVNDLAKRLVHLYQNRTEHIGFKFAEDDELQKQFEEDFVYELTKDQKSAIVEVKQDMESHKVMDRLICGDVGFGKTEVAMRAAFKAILSQKQVAFLCPTTILCLQHFKTFQERFKNFPVRIEMLNRFVMPKDQKRIIADLKEGKIDIVIGTHRLLSSDVQFKDLGFLVVDEEQRFGVEHKEKIKEIKNGVDVLALSATPIPRTLQMSLVGVRALSQLTTPPHNRLPIQTYIVEKNKGFIKDIIQRELSRNGQVFYLHNRVQSIYSVVKELQKELPDAHIGVVHGQMNREDIENAMIRFQENEYQVLVCTTIVETGIDIPNANTMIIEDADKFGLSQLYQIKGRVGRSDRIAYAYLLYTPQKEMSEIATKRLRAMKEFTQLGSGYKIALRDLTIRGAGDMLGPKQAGFIDTVGMDMYMEMLQDAILIEQGMEVERKKVKPKEILRQVDAYIPENFTTDDFEKLTLYQKIEGIKSVQEYHDFYKELEDNYGKLPKAVFMIMEKKYFELLLHDERIESFGEYLNHVEFIFSKEWSSQVDGVALFEGMLKITSEIKIRYIKNKIIIRLEKNKHWLFHAIQILEHFDDREEQKQ